MNKPMSKITNVSRRSVVQGLGVTGAMVLAAGATRWTPAAEAISDAIGREADDTLKNSVYLSLGKDGTVNVYIHRVEMGQGSHTGLPQIVADELGASWDRINFIQGIGDKAYGDQNTDGSTSIRKFYTIFREAGASARLMLQRAAAEKWGVAVSDTSVGDHKIKNNITGKSADFSEFVEAASKQPVPEKADLTFKSADKFTYIGKPVRNIHMDDIVTGNTTFGQDKMLDGMLFAVIARPPVWGGKVTSYDADAARAVDGVVDVIELKSPPAPTGFMPLGGVAIVAKHTWAAIKGREALNASFDGGVNANFDTDEFEARLWKSVDAPVNTFRNRGDVEAAIGGADKTVSADYFVPFLDHAPMEPPAATAVWEGDKVKVWSCCQDPQTVQQVVAGSNGIKPEDVWAMPTLLGGAFGRKSKPDFAAEAAILSRKTGKPIKVVWTREDQTKHGFFHTFTTQRVTGAFDGNGNVTAWDHTTNFPAIDGTFDPRSKGPSNGETGLGLLDMPFDTANLRIRAGEATNHVRVGWLRSVSNIPHAFAVGSFVDELAHAKGIKTDKMWMELIGDDRHVDLKADSANYGNYGESLESFPIDTARHKATLQKVVDMSGYGRKMEKGRGLGISVHRSFVSYVAAAVEVSVDADGMIKIEKAWMAIDPGLAVNPDRVKAQLEGSLPFAMSYVFHDEITVKEGKVQQGNFDTYPLVRIDECPDVDVAIIEHEGAPPGGVGEPGVPPVAPAITNAIFEATGKRIRRLPIKDQLSA